MMRVYCQPSILLLMLLPLSAAGESALDVAQKANLMGAWATSCATPIIPANSRAIYYAAPNGQLRRKIDRGAGYPALDSVVEYIEMIDATTVRLRFRTDSSSWGRANGIRMEAVMQNVSHCHCMRILSANAQDGSLFIKDGHLIENGDPAPLLEKCADPSKSEM
jgi:hypothetical protein